MEEYISTQILVNSEGTIFLLEISFKDKVKAKRCGARWYKDRKHWGCNYNNIEDFYCNWKKETEEENKKKETGWTKVEHKKNENIKVKACTQKAEDICMFRKYY